MLTFGWLLAAVVASPGAMANDDSPGVQVVRYPQMSSQFDQRNGYYEALLRLALEKSRDTFGDYQLQAVPLKVPQGRILRMLSAGEEVDVLWSMTSQKREQYLRPVRIPLTKGLAGYRLLIVRNDDVHRFSRIKSITDLAELVAGQGADWPDTDILRHNSLPVTTSGYFSLFTMLERERIDYMPRAVTEPWLEVSQRPEMDLRVEPTLLLHYPAATYFFVRQPNRALAERLEQGLEAAIKDGSFDELFYDHPSHKVVFEQSRLSERRILCLKNPLLPKQMPLERDEFWWRPPAQDDRCDGGLR